jgi:acetyl esterase
MLDAEAVAILDELRALNAPAITTVDVQTLRQSARLQPRPTGPGLARVTDALAAGPNGPVPVRLYRPRAGQLPVLVWLHGGGFAIGDIEMYDPLCRHLAHRTGYLVASVDYRLAPEHPYPAPGEDCYAAVEWVANSAAELDIDAGSLAVGGDSAGGTLTMVVAQMARDRGGPQIAFQLVAYGTAEMRISNPELGDLPILPNEACTWFWDLYVPDQAQRLQPYCSPLLADSLTDLPPAFVLTAEHDPTRDGAEEYARRLAASGVRTTLKRYPGTFHGFLSMPGLLTQARIALDDIAVALGPPARAPQAATEPDAGAGRG